MNNTCTYVTRLGIFQIYIEIPLGLNLNQFQMLELRINEMKKNIE